MTPFDLTQAMLQTIMQRVDKKEDFCKSIFFILDEQDASFLFESSHRKKIHICFTHIHTKNENTHEYISSDR